MTQDFDSSQTHKMNLFEKTRIETKTKTKTGTVSGGEVEAETRTRTKPKTDQSPTSAAEETGRLKGGNESFNLRKMCSSHNKFRYTAGC